MTIHFVCTHNTFRSRLAETYLNSKNIPNIKATSSGIMALSDLDGPISWYAQRIIAQSNIAQSEKLIWTQTTRELLEAQDLVIFIQPVHYDYCLTKLRFKGNNFEVWDIEDLNPPEVYQDTVAIQKSEAIFNKIKIRIEDLIARNFKPVGISA